MKIIIYNIFEFLRRSRYELSYNIFDIILFSGKGSVVLLDFVNQAFSEDLVFPVIPINFLLFIYSNNSSLDYFDLISLGGLVEVVYEGTQLNGVLLRFSAHSLSGHSCHPFSDFFLALS